ncbi:MAG TPA: purine-nucleoside phosphorylase [Solirubrobacteraceae bacterium]|nr:purine-nucleoside phosphorylase [Solirubrobacteraceae bacterium]
MSAVDVIRERAPGFEPALGIILGSGLGAVAEALEDPVTIPYGDLPGFPQPGVAGHAGSLSRGTLSGLPVAILQGRRHVYESGDAAGMRIPVRTLKAAGARALLATNAAGSLRADVGPGSLMAISDHINLLGVNPLTGPNDDEIGPRFPSLQDAYDPELRRALHRAAQALGISLAEGVYLATAGPSFETPAEIRAFRRLGADAVGMSTVPEVILARHAGLGVAAVSAITNLAEGMGGEALSHEQTLRFAATAAEDLTRLIIEFCAGF